MNLNEDIVQWQKTGTALIDQIQERIDVIDEERARLVKALRLIKSQPTMTTRESGQHVRKKEPAQAGPGRVYSILGQTILDIVMDSGEEGAHSSEIYEMCVEEFDDKSVRRDAVLTFISRMKKKGVFKAVGPRGATRYFYNEGSDKDQAPVTAPVPSARHKKARKKANKKR